MIVWGWAYIATGLWSLFSLLGASYCLAFNSEATSQGSCQDYHRQKQNSKTQTHKHMLGVAHQTRQQQYVHDNNIIMKYTKQ